MAFFIPFPDNRLPGGDLPLVKWLEIIERRPLKRGYVVLSTQGEKSITQRSHQVGYESQAPRHLVDFIN